MTKHNRTGRSKNKGRFIRLDYATWKSPEFQALHPYCKVLYLAIRARFNGENNGRIPFGLSDAQVALAAAPGKPASRATAHKYLLLLERSGFVVRVVIGHKGFEGKGRASEWRLTEEAANGQAPTREYRNRQPAIQVPGSRGDKFGSSVEPDCAKGLPKAA